MIMNALNSIAYERAELLRDVVYIENDITDNYDDDELFTEAASKFSVLPKFRKLVSRYPELKEYEKLVTEVNDLAVQTGNSDKITPMTARKIGTVLLKVWRALTSIGGVLTLPFCILLFPIVDYLINRLMVWGMETGELAIAESAILRSIQNATAIRTTTNDPAVRKKCDKLIKELNDKYQKLQVPEELRKTSKKAKAVKESVDFEDEELFTEATVKMNILPKFKTMVQRYPALQEYQSLVEEANELAMSAGSYENVTKTTINKVATFLLKIMRILNSVSTVIILPFCILIFPIIQYLLGRLVVWGTETGEVALAEKTILDSIKNLSQLKASTKDPSVTEKCEKLIDQLGKKLESLQKETQESADEDDFDVDDIEFTSMVDDDEDDDIDDDTLNDLLAAMPDTKDEDIERILEIDNDEPIDLDDVVGTNDDDEDIDIDDSELDDLE